MDILLQNMNTLLLAGIAFFALLADRAHLLAAVSRAPPRSARSCAPASAGRKW